MLVVAGWGLYLLANVRRSKPEIGSEIELAANRKQYLDDEQLEGPRLDRVLRWGLISLSIVGVGLLYRHGYFRQWLSRDGWQEETYPVLDPDELPLSLLREADGTPARITIGMPGPGWAAPPAR